MINKLKQNERLLSWILLNFAISFMFCVFAPIDAYYANMDEFWFSLPQMMSVCVIVFLILFAILDLIALLFYRTRISDILFAAFTAMFFFFYIQGNFIPRNYGVLKGSKINWGAYPGYAMASILLGGVCLALFVLFMKKFRKSLNTIGKLAAILLLCMMAGTSIILMIQNGIPSQKDTVVVTDENLWELSADRNVIVFILDTYDSEHFEHLLNEDPDGIAAIYENFTYYKDTLALYHATDTSVPFIFSGIEYLNQEPYNDYIKNINLQNSIYQTLQDNQYEANLYTKPAFFSTEAPLFSNVIKGTYGISNTKTFAKTIFKLIGFYYAPHQLKRFFDINTEAFSTCKKAEQAVSDFQWSTTAFADSFLQNGLSVTKKGNLFKLIHLEGCHEPFTFGSSLITDGNTYTAYDEAAGNNEVMRRYFETLKLAGIYDSSTIVVLADHGRWGSSQNPLFMIKNANESHPLKVSDAEMTYEYLPDILKMLLMGESVDDSRIRSFTPQYGKRRYLVYRPISLSHGYFAPIRELFCDGPAYNHESLKFSGKIYTADQSEYTYTLEKYYPFTQSLSNDAEAYQFIKYGGGPVDASGINFTENFLMHFNFENQKFDNLLVQFTLSDVNPVPWKYKIQANQNPVDEIQQSEDLRTVQFVIPKNYVTDTKLDLHCYLNEEDDMDGANIRTEMKVEGIKIISIPDSFLSASIEYINSHYYLGKNLDFPLKDKLSGFSISDSEFEGTDQYGTAERIEIIGARATLHFELLEEFNDLIANMKYQAPSEGIHVKFYANETLIYEVDTAGKQTVSLSIPKEAISDGHTLDLRIELPEREGLSPDAGSSGFYLQYLILDKNNEAVK